MTSEQIKKLHDECEARYYEGTPAARAVWEISSDAACNAADTGADRGIKIDEFEGTDDYWSIYLGSIEGTLCGDSDNAKLAKRWFNNRGVRG